MKLTGQQFRDLIKKGKVTIDYEHSILKKAGNPVAPLLPAKPEQDVRREPATANEAQAGGQAGGAGCLRFRVLLLRFGRKLLDDDNLASSFKHCRDQIAEELNIDDGDPAIEWEYGQVRTRGSLGTIVRIERL